MSCPVATLVIVTLAPLTTAPVGSLTIPTMLPVPTVVCATSEGVTLGGNKTATYTTAKVSTNCLALVRIGDEPRAGGRRGEADPCTAGRSGGAQALDPGLEKPWE